MNISHTGEMSWLNHSNALVLPSSCFLIDKALSAHKRKDENTLPIPILSLSTVKGMKFLKTTTTTRIKIKNKFGT
uniref:Uncharacterized protein n=1 Tax=Anguilla anguilla TaxID=7936 RepID=A0A0E9RZ81_ANGAN